MVRPASRHRAPARTLELLRRAARNLGNQVEIVIFGTTQDDPAFQALGLDFPCRLAGILNQRQVARLLNEVDIFVDVSSHQAMGLTALEAMACATAVIVPEQGGADAFARHGLNSLLVDTADIDECWWALERLACDHEFRRQLQAQALLDACQFYPEQPACRILDALFGVGTHGP
jgi:glycosyltransferase involved in cell wall biosynthesis